MNFIPTQPHLISDGFLAGRLEPLDHDGFKQGSEAAVGLGPRHSDNANTMLMAVGAGRSCVQDGSELTGVEMAPLPLWLMIVKRARRPAVRARPLEPLTVAEKDMNLTLA